MGCLLGFFASSPFVSHLRPVGQDASSGERPPSEDRKHQSPPRRATVAPQPGPRPATLMVAMSHRTSTAACSAQRRVGISRWAIEAQKTGLRTVRTSPNQWSMKRLPTLRSSRGATHGHVDNTLACGQYTGMGRGWQYNRVWQHTAYDRRRSAGSTDLTRSRAIRCGDRHTRCRRWGDHGYLQHRQRDAVASPGLPENGGAKIDHRSAVSVA